MSQFSGGKNGFDYSPQVKTITRAAREDGPSRKLCIYPMESKGTGGQTRTMGLQTDIEGLEHGLNPSTRNAERKIEQQINEHETSCSFRHVIRLSRRMFKKAINIGREYEKLSYLFLEELDIPGN